MIRVFAVAVCLIFVICLGLVLYTHYDTQKFIQSLPQPPHVEKTVSEKAADTERTPTESESIETSTDTPDTVVYTFLDRHDQIEAHGHLHPHDSHVESMPAVETEVLESTEGVLDESPIGENLPPGMVSWMHVLDGEVVIDREAFLAEFGNDPDAHTYLALHRTIHTADSYTTREQYEYNLLDKKFRQTDFPQSELDRLKRLMEINPNTRGPSWKALKNDPNVIIRIIDRRRF